MMLEKLLRRGFMECSLFLAELLTGHEPGGARGDDMAI
jgi:hypothetical protein